MPPLAFRARHAAASVGLHAKQPNGTPGKTAAIAKALGIGRAIVYRVLEASGRSAVISSAFPAGQINRHLRPGGA
jgi:hypothetical protein